jgi:phosphoribosylaminoimidazole carboxylase (NCAIR synthetase)
MSSPPAAPPRLRLGIVGGGQLGRMLALAAHSLGIRTTCLDSGGAASPAGQVTASLTGALTDAARLRELAACSDVLTVEIEHVDVDALEAAAAAAGIEVHPSPATLRTIQDKYAQKVFFQGRGVPLGDFLVVDTEAAVGDAIEVRSARASGVDGAQALSRVTTLPPPSLPPSLPPLPPPHRRLGCR